MQQGKGKIMDRDKTFSLVTSSYNKIFANW